MRDFEKYLMEKYPNLFYKKEDGSLECPCGVWVPDGWQQIVDDLCGAIMQYTTCTYRTNKKITNNMYYFWNTCVKVLEWCHLKFNKMFPKYNKWEFNKPVFSFINKFRLRSYKHTTFDKMYPPAIKIDQIKEKFATLRVYVSGGDEQVRGMISFAEYICEKTCEVSGKQGTIHSRNGWLKTLSSEIAQTQQYQDYKPVDKL